MQTEAAGRLRHREGAGDDPRALRHPDFGRGCLMARRLVERGVRMVQIYYGNVPAVGQPRRHPRCIAKLAQQTRPADRRAAGRSEGARAVRRHAGRSGAASSAARRCPELERLEKLGNGRDHNHHGFTMLAGRRRRQGRHGPTAPPTTSASRPSRTRSTSTTCTRRSCTCSASITRSSPIATPAATSA